MEVRVWMRCLRAETEIEGALKFKILCFPSSNFTNTWWISDSNTSIEQLVSEGLKQKTVGTSLFFVRTREI